MNQYYEQLVADVPTTEMVSDMLRRKVPGKDMYPLGSNAHVGYDPMFPDVCCSLRRFVFLERNGRIGACVYAHDRGRKLTVVELPEYAGLGLADDFLSGELLRDVFPRAEEDAQILVAKPTDLACRPYSGRYGRGSELMREARLALERSGILLSLTDRVLGMDRHGSGEYGASDCLALWLEDVSRGLRADERFDQSDLDELDSMRPLDRVRLWDYAYRNLAQCDTGVTELVSISDIGHWMAVETGACWVPYEAIRVCLEFLNVESSDGMNFYIDEAMVALHRWMMRLLDDPCGTVAETVRHDWRNDMAEIGKDQYMNTPEKLDCTRYTVHMDDGKWRITKVADPADGTFGWYYRHVDYAPVAYAFGTPIEGCDGAFLTDEDAVAQIMDGYFDGYREEHMND